MAVSIGTVYMNLRASSTNLRGDIQKSIGFTEKQFVAASKKIAKVVAGTLSGAAAALTTATTLGLRSVDQLAKTSDKLNIATEALQSFRHSAELTGASANTLDMGLQRMTRRISEAAQGTGEAKNALLELGLEARQLNSMTLDQQFIAISEAMKQVKNSADQVRLTQKLFDSEGVALVNTLRLGKEGLEAARNELDQFGLSISRIDAAKVERANDAITRISGVLSGFGQRAAIEVAPSIESIANALLNTAKAGNIVSKSTSGMNDGLLMAIGWAKNLSNAIHQAWLGFKSVMDLILLGLSKLALGGEKVFFGMLAAGGMAFSGLGYSVIRFVETALSAIKKLNKSLISIADFLPNVDGDALKVAVDAAFSGVDKSLADARNKTSKSMEGYWKDLTNISKRESNKYIKGFEAFSEANIEATLEEWRNAIENGISGDDLIAQIIAEREKINDEIRELEGNLNKPFEPISVQIPVAFSLEKSMEDLAGAPTQALKGFRAEFQRLSEYLNNGTIGIEKFQTEVGRLKDRVREAGQVFADTRTDAENYLAEIERINELHNQGLISAETYGRALEQTARKYDLNRKPIKGIQQANESYRKTIKALSADLENGAISQDTFNKEVENAGKKLQQTEESIRQHMETIGRMWDSVNMNIERSIDDLVDHGKLSFKDLARSIVNDLTKIALKQALFGGGLGSGGGILGGIMKALPFFADGGRPFVGRPNIVGEKGPELFIPDQAGTIIPSDQTMKVLSNYGSRYSSPAVQFSQSGGMKPRTPEAAQNIESRVINVSMDQTNNFETGVSAGDVATALKEHGQQMIDGITDAFRRGGSFRQVFQS